MSVKLGEGKAAEAYEPTRLLRLRDERRERQAESNTDSEYDRESDPPHAHLCRGWLAGSLAERG